MCEKWGWGYWHPSRGGPGLLWWELEHSPPPFTPFLVSIYMHQTVGGRKLHVLYHVSWTWDWNEAAILWVSARAWYMYIIKSKWMHCVRYCQLLENNMESIIKWYMYVLPPLFPIFMRGISRDGNDSILWKYNCNAMKIDLHRVIALGRFLNNVGHTTGVVAANC